MLHPARLVFHVLKASVFYSKSVSSEPVPESVKSRVCGVTYFEVDRGSADVIFSRFHLLRGIQTIL